MKSHLGAVNTDSSTRAEAKEPKLCKELEFPELNVGFPGKAGYDMQHRSPARRRHYLHVAICLPNIICISVLVSRRTAIVKPITILLLAALASLTIDYTSKEKETKTEQRQ